MISKYLLSCVFYVHFEKSQHLKKEAVAWLYCI